MSGDEIDWSAWPELTDEQIDAAWAKAEESADEEEAQEPGGFGAAPELLFIRVGVERGHDVDGLHRKVELVPRPGSDPGAQPTRRRDVVVVPSGRLSDPGTLVSEPPPGWYEFITGGPVEPLQTHFAADADPAGGREPSRVTPLGSWFALAMGAGPAGVVGTVALCFAADALINAAGRQRGTADQPTHVPNVPPRVRHVTGRTRGPKPGGRGLA